MAKKRTKIPHNIETDVMLKSKGLCYCGKRGVHIHHIDENPSNNNFDNLVFLCFEHHDDASVKNVLRKRLNPKQIKEARNKLYKENELKDQLALKHYTKTLKTITDENLYQAALEANITIEIIKITDSFLNESDWKKREKILWEVRKFSEHTSLRISSLAFNFFLRISGLTRSNMPSSMSDSIQYLTFDFFPYSKKTKDKKSIIDISRICGEIAHAIIYDAFIHLVNLAVACSGLELLKYLWLKSKELKIAEIENIVLGVFAELERTLKRPERTDLEDSRLLLSIYKDDLKNPILGFPQAIPSNLFELIDSQRG